MNCVASDKCKCGDWRSSPSPRRILELLPQELLSSFYLVLWTSEFFPMYARRFENIIISFLFIVLMSYPMCLWPVVKMSTNRNTTSNSNVCCLYFFDLTILSYNPFYKQIIPKLDSCVSWESAEMLCWRNNTKIIIPVKKDASPTYACNHIHTEST